MSRLLQKKKRGHRDLAPGEVSEDSISNKGSSLEKEVSEVSDEEDYGCDEDDEEQASNEDLAGFVVSDESGGNFTDDKAYQPEDDDDINDNGTDEAGWLEEADFQLDDGADYADDDDDNGEPVFRGKRRRTTIGTDPSSSPARDRSPPKRKRLRKSSELVATDARRVAEDVNNSQSDNWEPVNFEEPADLPTSSPSQKKKVARQAKGKERATRRRDWRGEEVLSLPPAFSLSRVEDLTVAFGTYIQYLTSASLDPDFVRCVEEERGNQINTDSFSVLFLTSLSRPCHADAYFLASVRIVEGKADMLKHLVVSSSAWNQGFKVL